jgi:hypothetical protein
VKKTGGCRRLIKIERVKMEMPKLSPEEIRILIKNPKNIIRESKPTMPVSARKPKIKLWASLWGIAAEH